MSILLSILIGTFVGWLVAAYADLDEGIFLCMTVGALGGVIGGRLAASILTDTESMLYKILLTVIGAVVFALIGRAFAVNKRDVV